MPLAKVFYFSAFFQILYFSDYSLILSVSQKAGMKMVTDSSPSFGVLRLGKHCEYFCLYFFLVTKTIGLIRYIDYVTTWPGILIALIPCG